MYIDLYTMMFYKSQAITLDLSGFDTSSVTNMSYMFFGSQVTSLDLSNFDTSKVTDMRSMFSNSKVAILDLSNFDTSNVTNMASMFKESSATTLDISNFNTSKVTSMFYMFSNSKATTLDLSSFDTRNVTTMDYMFEKSLATKLDLSSFDTSNVTGTSSMFESSKATVLDLSSFDTSKFIFINDMFRNSKANTVYIRTQVDKDKMSKSYRCSVPADHFIVGKPPAPLSSNLELSSTKPPQALRANGDKATSTKYPYAISKGYITTDNYVTDTMTQGGVTIEVFDNGHMVFRPTDGVRGVMYTLYSWTTPWKKISEEQGKIKSVSFESGVIAGDSLKDMFNNSKATMLDLSNFDTSNVTNMSYMFEGSQATTLDLSNFNTSKVTNMSEMFYNSQATVLDLSSFDTSNVTDMSYMFKGSQATTLDLSNFDTRNVKDMRYMFWNSQATKLNLSSFNTSKVTNMSYMFRYSQATTLDLSNFDTGNVKDMAEMFSHSKATTIDVSNFNTSNVTNMRQMFSMSQATTLDVSNFDTSNVTNMESMFNQSRVQTLNLSNFNTSNVTDMSGMFADSEVTTLDLSSFDTSKVTEMRSMFFGAKTKVLDISNFNTNNVTDMDQMFKDSELIKIIISSLFTFHTPVPVHSFPYTGKWIREDKVFGPYAPSKLAEIFNSNPAVYAGAWIAERYQPLTIKYDNNGELGVMKDSEADIRSTFAIPKSSFSSFGKRFVSWNTNKDGNGTKYMPGQKLYVQDNQSGKTLTLYAQWEDLGGLKKIGDNMYEVYIPGNSKVTIKDLPAGLSYEIYEETEDGWVLVKSENSTGTIKPLEESKAKFTNEKTNDKVSVVLEGKKLLDGKDVSGYEFQLLENGKVINTLKSIDGNIKFNPIVLDKTGSYVYTIKEVNTGDESIVYDNHEETVTINVTRNDKDTLVAKVTGDEDGIVFKNSRRKVNLELSVENLIPNKYLPGKETEGCSPYDTNKTFDFEVITNDDTDNPHKVTLPKDGSVKIPVNYGDKVSIKELKLPPGFRLKGFNDTDKKDITIEKIIVDAKVKATNIYEPKGYYNLDIKKNMVGRDAVDGEFFYQIKTYDKDENIISTPLAELEVNGKVNIGDNVVNSTNVIDKIKENAKNLPEYTKDELAALSKKLLDGNHDSDIRTNINGSIFEDMLYARIGTQYISIMELPYNINKDNNIKFDTEPVIIKVEGKDNGDGTISTTIEYLNKKQTFNNRMSEGSLKITKTIDGRDNKDFQYEFFNVTIKLLDANGVELTDSYKMGHTTVKSGDTIELNPGIPTVIEGLPHGSSYELTEEERPYYELSDKSTLSGKIEAGKESEANVVNIYKPSGEVIIRGYKTLENADIANYKFSFLLLKDKEIVAEASNDADGNFEFPAIKLKEEDVGKTFEYTVVEAPGNIKNIKYDDSEQTAKFTVFDNEGRLQASFDTGGVTSDLQLSGFTAFFNNVYINTAKLQLIKTGENDKPLAGVEFELLDENKENVLINGKKVVIKTDEKGNGNIVDGLTAGTYYLNETKVPEGYIKADLVKFKIDNSDLNGTKVVKVKNRMLAVLPVTGLLESYCSAMFIMLLIAVAFIDRRRLARINK